MKTAVGEPHKWGRNVSCKPNRIADKQCGWITRDCHTHRHLNIASHLLLCVGIPFWADSILFHGNDRLINCTIIKIICTEKNVAVFRISGTDPVNSKKNFSANSAHLWYNHYPFWNDIIPYPGHSGILDKGICCFVRFMVMSLKSSGSMAGLYTIENSLIIV